MVNIFTEEILRLLEGFSPCYPQCKGIILQKKRFLPETPPPLREKFVRTALLVEAKAEGILKELALFSGDLIKTNQNALEIGYGTGGFLISAVKTYFQVIGTDIALRLKGVSYKNYRLLSYFELKNLLNPVCGLYITFCVRKSLGNNGISV